MNERPGAPPLAGSALEGDRGALALLAGSYVLISLGGAHLGWTSLVLLIVGVLVMDACAQGAPKRQVNRAKSRADLQKRTSPTSETARGGRCEITLAGPEMPCPSASQPGRNPGVSA
jgi:hypothetical protein